MTKSQQHTAIRERARAAAGRYHSERARAYYIARSLRARDCDALAGYERITAFAQLYEWGRRIPGNLIIQQRDGTSFEIRDDFADQMSIARAVDLTLALESFTHYVTDWIRRVAHE